jgi:hypothetical protein
MTIDERPGTKRVYLANGTSPSSGWGQRGAVRVHSPD